MDSVPEDILTLIAARLCGEKLTAEEEKRLDQWLEAGENHQKSYRYYQDFFSRKAELYLFDRIQRPEEIAKILFRSQPTRLKRIMHMTKYAAIIIPALFFTILLILYRPTEKVKPQFPLAQLKDIAPGKQKARLQLGDGKIVSLSDSSMIISAHKEIQVEDGGILQYVAQEGKSQEKTVYHTLVVDKGGEFQLVLPDGTKVWLNSASELKYPNAFSGNKRQVYLKGEAYFEVKRSDTQLFIVSTAGCDIKVLGTEFNVSSYDTDKEVVTTLVQGKVAYTAGKQSGELRPGEQCVYEKDQQIAKVQQVNVGQYISWKNGLFTFDKISMENLAKQISRWYDVEVIFPDQSARSVSFTGAMERYKPVSYIIQLLNETNTVECRLEGNMLVFRKK